MKEFTCDHVGGQVQDLQVRPAGQRPREELMLQLESKSCLLDEFPHFGEKSIFFSIGLQTIN